VTRAKTILVSAGLLHSVSKPLSRSGFETVSFPDLDWPLLDRATVRIADLLIWDPFRAAGDVQQACLALRRLVQVPILALSAQGEASERAMVMESGVDSCLALPLHGDELVARVRALLRRSSHAGAPSGRFLSAGELEVDVSRHLVRHGSSSISLRPREFALVVELVRHANQVVSRDLLLDRVWGLRGPYHRTVDVHMVHLREKLNRAGVTEPRIQTVRGVGYRLAVERETPGVGVGEVVLTPMPCPWLHR
jgi:two-component system phosphate regulon response regulator PhoB